jgi:hypothetical protein
MQITGIPAVPPACAMRARAIAPYGIASGASRAETIPVGRHQNEGSRMVRAPIKTQVHEIRIERSDRTLERTGKGIHGL